MIKFHSNGFYREKDENAKILNGITIHVAKQRFGDAMEAMFFPFPRQHEKRNEQNR